MSILKILKKYSVLNKDELITTEGGTLPMFPAVLPMKFLKLAIALAGGTVTMEFK